MTLNWSVAVGKTIKSAQTRSTMNHRFGGLVCPNFRPRPPTPTQVLVFNGSAELLLGLLLVNKTPTIDFSLRVVPYRGGFLGFPMLDVLKTLQVRLPLHNLPSGHQKVSLRKKKWSTWVVILRKHAVAILPKHTTTSTTSTTLRRVSWMRSSQVLLHFV